MLESVHPKVATAATNGANPLGSLGTQAALREQDEFAISNSAMAEL